MGRAAVKLGVRELAAQAQISPNTITRVEADGAPNAATLAAIGRALEAAGVEFLPDNGVRLRPATVKAAAGGTGSRGAKKPTASKTTAPQPRKPAQDRKKAARATPTSKEAQLRALREQTAR
jgi:transcriptional regulator with XRE-family HTH domain